jgi:hypothetical protein
MSQQLISANELNSTSKPTFAGLYTTGNVGINTNSPLPWSSGNSLSIGTQGIFSTDTTNTNIGWNVYYNSGYKIAATGSVAGGLLTVGSYGRLGFYITSSGTAGNTSSLTQYFYIDGTNGATFGPTTGTATDSAVNISNTNFYSNLNFQNNGTSFAAIVGYYGNGIIYNAGIHVFRSYSGTEFMRLDSNGNLGLGVTPNAWYSNRRALQIGGLSVPVVASTVDGFDLMNNSYTGAGAADFYVTNGYAAKFRMGSTSGQFQWFTAGSGTAGNVASFTQAMTLDNSGNLLVGLSSALANGKFQVAGGIGLSGNTQIRQATNGDGNTLQLFATQVVVGSGNSLSYGYTGGGLLASVSSSASAILLDAGGYTAGHRLQVVNDGTGISGTLNYSNAGTSRFYVNSSTGYVGIGTTSPSYLLDVVANQNASTISSISNTTSGTAAYAALRVTSDTNSWLYSFSSGYTTSGRFAAGTTLLDVGGANGLGISTSQAAPIVFYTSTTERARIDSSGNLGIGTTSPSSTGAILTATTGIAVTSNSGNFNTSSVQIDYLSGVGRISSYAYTGSALAFYTNPNANSVQERARIDSSGNLVIGATSATAKLDVYNGQSTQLRVRGTSTRTSSSVLGAFEDDSNGGKGSWGSNAYAGTQYSNALTRYQTDISGWGILGNNFTSTYTVNDSLLFQYVSTAGTTTEYARIDYQGNFGLGVTPSTWYSTFKAFQFGANGSSIFGRSENNTAGMASNAYINASGAWTYINTNYASYYQQLNGQHQWNIAPSGTAGNAISFTQAMTLDNSGNLGIGTTSPAQKLDVNGYIQSSSSMKVNQGSGAGSAGFWIGYTTASTASRSWITLTDYSQYGDWGVYQSTTQTGTTWANKLYIDPTGNVGIGTSSPSYKLQVQGYVYANSGFVLLSQASGGGSLYEASGSTGIAIGDTVNALRFTTNSTERVRIDSNGNLLVGTTDNSGSNTQGLEVYIGSGATRLYIGHASGTVNGTQYVVFNYAGTTQIGSISQSGTTAVLYNTTSDQRLKNDLGTVTSTDVIANTIIHDFTWKSDGSQARGVFAQEAVKVLPAAVKVGDDGEEVTDTWAVDYSKYVPDLIVYCQQLKAELDIVKTELAALKS